LDGGYCFETAARQPLRLRIIPELEDAEFHQVLSHSVDEQLLVLHVPDLSFFEERRLQLRYNYF
jgi:hypothetical protein